MATGADLLVHCLHGHGVRVLFGMPGSHTTALYDACIRHGGIRTVLVRNEQAAAFAADGYARVTGRPGVVCTTAGPGATNALTGVAEAWADSSPVLLVSGQVNHDKLDREYGNYHEIDLDGIFRPCTRFVATVRANEQIPDLVRRAFTAMMQGRPRPAALFLPQDLAVMPAPGPSDIEPLKVVRALPALDDVRRGAELLGNAERPIILAGGGAVSSDAGVELLQLARRLDCPIITTLNGKGVVDERDPHSLGHGRSVQAMSALNHADAMLAVGCRFTEVFTWFQRMRVPERLVQIDVEPEQIGVNYPAAVGIVGDAKVALQALLEQAPASRGEWRETWAPAKKLTTPKPEWFITALRDEMPGDAVVFTDACEMALRMHTDWPAYGPRAFFYPSTFIALGWGFPAAVGAAVALPNCWVVSVSGDGGFVMTCQELATAARYQLRQIILIHNDSAYGAIKNLQAKKHEGRHLDTDLINPDFVQLAASFGVPGCRVHGAAEYRIALREALGRSGPSLIEVPDEWRSLRL